MSTAQAAFSFGENAFLAVSPMLTLTLGVLLLLVAEIVAALRPLRALIFAGSLIAALWCELVLMWNPVEEAVFQGTYLADPTRAARGPSAGATTAGTSRSSASTTCCSCARRSA
jgi:hypothetical protein